MSNSVNRQSSALRDFADKYFSEYENNLNGKSGSAHSAFRKQAFNSFSNENFPTRRDEDWKYTGISQITRKEYKIYNQTASGLSHEHYINREVNGVRLFFINGVFQEKLSDDYSNITGLKIIKLENAMEDASTRDWILDISKLKNSAETNAFVPLNLSISNSGLYIHAEKNAIISDQIIIQNINIPDPDAHMSSPQLFVKTELNSILHIVDCFNGAESEAGYFNNVNCYFDLEKNSQCTYIKLQDEALGAFQIHNIHVQQDQDSTFTSFASDLGGSIVRNNISSVLKGSGTNTNFLGIYLGAGDQHIDTQSFMDHAMPHCESNELYKGILNDKARGVFNGKVMVRQDAQKTNAFQQNSSLVLSSTAVMDTKPQLEIFADDVKCSHGATIGQLDDKSVFYLKTRGIPQKSAENLLQKAFLGEVVLRLKDESIKAEIFQKIESKLNHNS